MSRPTITITTENGEFAKTNKFLERMLNLVKLGKLDVYGKKGVKALAEATPVGETGVASESWYYVIKREKGRAKLIFCNSDVPENATINVALLLQYGHATRNGIFVEGIDYINPALQPVFGEIASWIIKEVKGH